MLLNLMCLSYCVCEQCPAQLLPELVPSTVDPPARPQHKRMLQRPLAGPMKPPAKSRNCLSNNAHPPTPPTPSHSPRSTTGADDLPLRSLLQHQHLVQVPLLGSCGFRLQLMLVSAQHQLQQQQLPARPLSSLVLAHSHVEAAVHVHPAAATAAQACQHVDNSKQTDKCESVKAPRLASCLIMIMHVQLRGEQNAAMAT